MRFPWSKRAPEQEPSVMLDFLVSERLYLSVDSFCDFLFQAEGVWPESKEALRGVRGALLEKSVGVLQEGL